MKNMVFHLFLIRNIYFSFCEKNSWRNLKEIKNGNIHKIFKVWEEKIILLKEEEIEKSFSFLFFFFKLSWTWIYLEEMRWRSREKMRSWEDESGWEKWKEVMVFKEKVMMKVRGSFYNVVD